MTKAVRRDQSPRQASAVQASQPLPGSLALDLINTEVIERGKSRDLLPSPEALARWWDKVYARYPDECSGAGSEPLDWTDERFAAVKALRTALRTLITRVVEQQAVEEAELAPLNAALALGDIALERTVHGAVQTMMRPRNDEQGRILVPIARSALRLLTELDWQRLHQCKSDRCVIFFYDTTKSATRRWCSLGCMNRARSMQHYQRIKKQAPER